MKRGGEFVGRTKEYLRMILRSTRGSVVVDRKQEKKVLCCSKVVELLFLRGLRVTYDVLWFLSIRVIVDQSVLFYFYKDKYSHIESDRWGETS